MLHKGRIEILKFTKIIFNRKGKLAHTIHSRKNVVHFERKKKLQVELVTFFYKHECEGCRYFEHRSDDVMAFVINKW